MTWDDNLEGPSRQIAASDHTPLRVRAGPGTGKTFTLIRRIARLLENGTAPCQILVSTFTRTAAGDLQRELKSLAVPGADSVRATTVHALCFSILARNEVLEVTGRVPRPLLEYEKRFLLTDLHDKEFGNIHEQRRRLKAFEAAWARLQSDQPGWPQNPVDQRFQKQLSDWLRFHQAMLIGELVPEALRYLRNNPASAERTAFSHVLVDEYQDLNAAEQELIQLVAENARLTIIGDEDQSIYSFKYAHPEGIADFHERHPDTKDETLDLCRRCPTNIVQMAYSLIANNRRRTNRALIPHPENGAGEVHIVQWQSMEQEAEGLAAFIKGLVRSGRVEPGRVLVLAPRRQFGYSVRDALNKRGVQAHSFFQEEALDGDPTKLAESRVQQAFTLLTLAANPEDSVALRCWCGFGSASLRREAWDRIRGLCARDGVSLRAALHEIGSGRLKIPRGANVVARLRELTEHLRRLAPLRGEALLNALFPADNPEFAQLRTMAARLDPEADAPQLLDRLRTSITQPELPTDVDYVRVMSLHKSKGLTADLVVVMGCVEGLVPTLPDPKGATDEEQLLALEEQRRLFYVSITRARKILVLSSVTGLPRNLAYQMGVKVRGRGTPVRTITSGFIHELGPAQPKPIRGEDLLRMASNP
jgi:superfamily I DNA/RNA helicase